MGTVVLSVDAELGWGWHDLPKPPTERVESARKGWRRLLDLLDTYRLPSTWAVVGHLFLDECDGYHRSHPLGPSWFDRERTEWSDRPDLRFGTDLIDLLLSAEVDHDVGCHTFSHVEFGDPDVTQDVARAELTAFIDVTEDYDLPFESFIFPRNNVGNRDVVAEWGFSCYRGSQPTVGPSGAVSRPLRKIAHATVSAPPVVTPSIDEYGLVNVPASLFLFGMQGMFRRISESVWEDPVVVQARRGIDRVAARGNDAVFHMWLHPNNLTGPAAVRRLHAIFDYLSDRRDRGDVHVRTMADVAEWARETPTATMEAHTEEPRR